MGEGEKTWLAYARLKPLMSDAPAQLRRSWPKGFWISCRCVW